MDWVIETNGERYRVKFSDGEFLRKVHDASCDYRKGGTGTIVVFGSYDAAHSFMEHRSVGVDHTAGWSECG